MSKLLVFAHYHEAKAFIDGLKVKKESQLGLENLWMNEERTLAIFICGSDRNQLLIHLTKLMERLPVVEVYNMGVAGMLDGRLREFQEKMEIISIECVYEYTHKPTFKSHVSDDKDASVDLMTYFDEVKDAKLAKRLSHFAGLVDMEGYCVASVAKSFGAKLFLFKVISDSCEEEVDRALVMRDAEKYSLRLLEYFQTFQEKRGETVEVEKNSNYPNVLYATQSQVLLLKQYDEKLRKMGITDGVDEVLTKHLSELMSRQLTEKEKTKQVLNYIQGLLDPSKAEFERRMEEVVKPLKSVGIDFEVNLFNRRKSKFSFVFEEAEGLKKKVQALKEFDVKTFNELCDGDWGV